mgnify:CR=1 FL=1
MLRGMTWWWWMAAAVMGAGAEGGGVGWSGPVLCRDPKAGAWRCGRREADCCAVVEGRGFCVPCPAELEAWLPSPLHRMGAAAELRVCRGRLCATDDEPGFGPHRCRYEEPLLRGLVPSVLECGGGAECCVAFRAARGQGRWVGLGCESCLVGLTPSASVQQWRGGGGGRHLPRAIGADSSVCVFRALYCLSRSAGGGGGAATTTTTVAECGREEQCCWTGTEGAKGCASCSARLRLRRCPVAQRCLCRGALCNARHPRLFPDNRLPHHN